VLDLEMSGAINDWRKPSEWRGSIRELEIAGTDRRMMHLTEPVDVHLAADKASVEHFCFAGILGARVCAELAWVADRSLDIRAEVEDFPVNHVNQWLATGYEFDQRVTGLINWHRSADQQVSGEADIKVSPGTVRSLNSSELTLATGAGAMRLDIRDGATLDGELHLPLPGTGNIDGEFALDDLRQGADSGIRGTLELVADDIALLQIFVPLIDKAAGSLSSKLELSGSLRAPLASGEVHLQNAAVNYRPLGLAVSDLQINSRFDADKSFDLQGTFRAGEGRGELSTHGNFEQATQAGLEVVLRGENLTVINVPDVHATADADIRIGIRKEILSINGKVVVPKAKISPKSLPAARQSASDDVVIVAGALEGEPVDQERSPLKLSGILEVGFGDDVVVDLDVAQATVTGSAKFEWQESLMPIADGRYELTGDVQAYGQLLEITEGLIRFPKVPANNPRLRIRAERDIFGNSQVKRAGILVDGTAKQPTVEAYTEPRTTEERALTLLVTGSDFDLEQGVGAIDFGTYIAPKLFVSYGVGLFDQENVISARYDLGRGFGVKASSGQKESGVDLIYRIER
jgi:translocation and assembly module TamB